MNSVVFALVVIGLGVIGGIAAPAILYRENANHGNDISAYCGDTYTLDVSPLRTKVSCRGENFVIFPNVDEMSPEEFRAYLEAKEAIPIGLKRDLRAR